MPCALLDQLGRYFLSENVCKIILPDNLGYVKLIVTNLVLQPREFDIYIYIY